jgi:hypothetical protein
MRTIMSLSIATLFAASAFGQYPAGGYQPGLGGANGSGVPGLYGGGLNPYLNLRGRNLNPAVQYYNFTRPYTGGTFGNAFVGPGGGAAAGPAAGMSRFFPNATPFYSDEEPGRQRIDESSKPDENGLRPVQMPPAGHGGGFNNTMGFFGSTPGAGAHPAATLGRPRGTR